MDDGSHATKVNHFYNGGILSDVLLIVCRYVAQPQHATRDVRFHRILGAPGIFGTIIIASQSTEVCP